MILLVNIRIIQFCLSEQESLVDILKALTRGMNYYVGSL